MTKTDEAPWEGEMEEVALKKATDYLHVRMPIPEDRLPKELAGRPGFDRAALDVSLYYSKDASRRGLKLSIARMALRSDGSYTVILADPTGGYMHMLDMDRKNDKVGRAAAGAVREALHGIYHAAMASDRPDFQGLCNVLADKIRKSA